MAKQSEKLGWPAERRITRAINQAEKAMQAGRNDREVAVLIEAIGLEGPEVQKRFLNRLVDRSLEFRTDYHFVPEILALSLRTWLSSADAEYVKAARSILPRLVTDELAQQLGRAAEKPAFGAVPRVAHIPETRLLSRLDSADFVYQIELIGDPVSLRLIDAMAEADQLVSRNYGPSRVSRLSRRLSGGLPLTQEDLEQAENGQVLHELHGDLILLEKALLAVPLSEPKRALAAQHALIHMGRSSMDACGMYPSTPNVTWHRGLRDRVLAKLNENAVASDDKRIVGNAIHALRDLPSSVDQIEAAAKTLQHLALESPDNGRNAVNTLLEWASSTDDDARVSMAKLTLGHINNVRPDLVLISTTFVPGPTIGR